MAKKASKRKVHTEAYATKDTFWNRERIKRGITYQQIADRYKVTPTSACKWFVGKSLPRSTDTIWDLCEWFTDTPYTDGSSVIITHDRGLYELEKAHEIYEVEFEKQKILRADPKIEIVDAKINSDGFSATDFLNNLLKNRRLTQTKLGLEIDISTNVVRRFIHGVCMPSDEQIIKMADVLKYNPDKLTTIFKHAYNKQHNIEGPCMIENVVTNEPDKKETKEVIKSRNTSIENRNVNTINFLLKQRHITYKQLASKLKCTVTMVRRWIKGLDVPNDVYIEKMADILEYNPDKLNDLFEKAYHKYRNVEGQIDISEAIEDTVKEPEPEVKFSPEVEDALKKMADHHDDHERFIKWFNFLSSISPARISDKDVANIMTEYVNCNYCMYEAMEAWHNEYHPNYVHERYILLICDRKRWFGEDYETGTWLIEGL